MTIPKQSVGIRQSKSELFGFRVDGTGTAAISEGQYHATLTDNGTGDYTLTFVRPFARTPVVAGMSLTADAVLSVSSVSTTAVRVKARTVAASPAAVDAVFHLLVLGFFSDTER